MSALFALIAIIIIHLFVNVVPILVTVTGEEIKNSTTIIVNEAVKSLLGDTVKYGDIVSITRDKEDNIESLSVNTILVNGIARDTTLITQSKLKMLGQTAIGVPLGTLSGITVLGGKGPIVKVNILPVGSVSVSFSSSFQRAGINNTLHTITMVVDTAVNVLVPGISQNVSIKTDVPLVNTVIIGKIPDTYLQSGQLDEMLNLVP